MSSGLTVDIFLSVDGWAGSDGLPGYFGYLGPELEEWIASELAAPQRLVMGRRTYEALAAHGAMEPMSELETVVFSRTLQQADGPNTRICREDALAEIPRMKAASDVPLRTMGSLSLARQLIGAGLVDRLRLMTFPLLAGEFGREAAFEDVRSGELELVDHRAFDRRVLLIEYRPTGGDVPRS